MFKPRKIVKDTDPKLREKSLNVELPLSKEDEELCEYLIEHLRVSQDEELSVKYNLRPGVGIAAPQVGEQKRIFAVRLEEDEDKVLEMVLINPKIIDYSVMKACLQGGEGCLSVEKDYEGYVYRHNTVTVEAYDYISKQVIKKKFRGYEAIVLQHEMDHFDGVLYYDHINKENPLKVEQNSIII